MQNKPYKSITYKCWIGLLVVVYISLGWAIFSKAEEQGVNLFDESEIQVPEQLGAPPVKRIDEMSTVERVAFFEEVQVKLQEYWVANNDYPSIQLESANRSIDRFGLPETLAITEYETAYGQHGYQVTWQETTASTTLVELHSFGVGPEAARRTFIKTLFIPDTASST